MEESYNKLKSEIEEFVSDAQQESNFKKYYKGTQILYSNLHYRPKFMFVGINPGAGYYKQNKTLVSKFEPEKKLEYSYTCYKYALSRNTRKLFKKAGCYEYFEDAVKSNCFFFATKSEKELYSMLSHVKYLEVYKKSHKWIKELVDMVNPEIIICEGKSSFEKLCDICKCTYKWENNVGYAIIQEIKVIGYKRRFSDILHESSVVKVIQASI